VSTFGAAVSANTPPALSVKTGRNTRHSGRGTPCPEGTRGGSPEQKKQDGATFPADHVLIYPASFWLSVARSIREREARG
jgi:hypothetical protein